MLIERELAEYRIRSEDKYQAGAAWSFVETTPIYICLCQSFSAVSILSARIDYSSLAYGIKVTEHFPSPVLLPERRLFLTSP